MNSDSESPQETPDEADGRTATDRVVAAFGGIRPMAGKLGTPVTTVQGWKKRGAIPQLRHEAIRAAAAAHGIALDDAILSATAPPDAHSEPARPASRTPPGSVPRARTVMPAPEEHQATDEAGPAEEPEHVAEPPIPEDQDSAEDREPAEQPEPEAAPEPEPEVAPRPEAAAPRPSSAVAWLAVFVALVSVGLVVTAPLWIDRAYRVVGLTVPSGTGPAFDPNRLNALDDRLAAMEQQVAALSARSDPDVLAEALRAEIEAISGRLAALEDIDPQGLDARIAAVGGAVEGLAQDIARMDGVLGSQRIALTEARSIVTRLEARADEAEAGLESIAAIQERDGRRIERLIASDSATQALVLAIGQLRVAVDSGQPYQQPLASLRALASGVDEMVDALAALAPAAATGVPDRDTLKSRFPGMADAVRQAVLLPADAGWMDRTVARIEGLVTVRPAPGEVDGDDAAAVLARAEGRLNTGDLPGAVAAIDMLDGEAAAAAAAWRRSAQARLAAEAALENLNSFAIARLANTESDRSTP